MDSPGADGPSFGDALRAGVAVYNAGHYHAAHDAWEGRWLALERGTDDERLLHGLIQFTAAVHHATRRNWDGATGLADSAGEYLADLPSTYRGVNVGDVRDWLARLAADPEVVERAPLPRLRHEGRAIALADLEFPAASVAAVTLAEDEGYDEAPFERAAEYAFADLAAGEASSPFVGLLLAFVGGEERAVVAQRLREHVERRDQRERDVEGLFDSDG